MKKRSISIHGHATSVALELEFWDIVDEAAVESGGSVSALLRGLDDRRLKTSPDQGLASYIRVWALGRLQSKLTGETSD